MGGVRQLQWIFLSKSGGCPLHVHRKKLRETRRINRRKGERGRAAMLGRGPVDEREEGRKTSRRMRRHRRTQGKKKP